LEHLSDEEREARQDILAHFEHVEALGYKPRESLEQLIREIAFTHLNRFCAYKMMEVRDVYVGGIKFREAVSKGLKSQGFLFYLAEHPEDEQRYNAGQQEEAYRHFLNWLGGTLSQEIGVLFSPTDPANRVYPPQRVLDEILDLLNGEELKGIWSEDETIGWVYQYFTPKELRDQARKESQAPRNSYELAFRNQFFTPRYVVEFLTDNTLARIWYEMRRGNTRLKDECRYMVRRPGEVFFSEKEDEPGSPVGAMKDMLLGGTEETFPPFRVGETQGIVELAHTVDGYERHPFEDQVEGEWWPWAKLRKIREAEDLSRFHAQDLLDVLFCQARADRHGGGYCDWDAIFYEIANEIRRRAIEGRKEDASQEQLLRAVTAILPRSKKDPREIKILDPACGSGHFLLYCFALLLVMYEEAYDDPDLGPALQADYPTKDELRRDVPGLILRRNLHGIDIDLRCTQIAALALWLRCQRAFQEVGLKKGRPRITKSNIVCAEPMPGEGHMLREFVAQVEPKLLGQLVEVVFEKMKLAGEAGSLLKIEDEIRDAVDEARRQWRIRPAETQMRMFGEQNSIAQQRFDLSGITDAAFFEHAEAKVVEALRSYVEQSQNGHRLQRSLFTDDAVRGFAFVDICHKRFEVVLMNPPFGDFSKQAKTLLDTQYTRTKNDVYASFVEQGLNRLNGTGMLGAITSRTGFLLSSFKKWREEVLLNRVSPTTFADLGYGVLDTAMVETAAYCLARSDGHPITDFFRVLADDNKEASLRTAIEANNAGIQTMVAFHVDPSSFKQVPDSPFVYWISEQIRRVFSKLPPFESKGRTVKQGLATADDFRFIRCWWEVPPEQILDGMNGPNWRGNLLEFQQWCRQRTFENKRWVSFAKGGEFSPFYVELTSVVNWERDGEEMKAWAVSLPGTKHWSRRLASYDYYFCPGLTYGRRIRTIAPGALPPGSIFSHSACGIYVKEGGEKWLPALASFLNSEAFRGLLATIIPDRQMEVGYVQRMPMPLEEEQGTVFDLLNNHFVSSFRRALLRNIHEKISHCYYGVNELEIHNPLSSEELDCLIYRLYGLSEDRSVIRQAIYHREDVPNRSDLGLTEDEFSETLVDDVLLVQQDNRPLSYSIGCLFGRWDIRFATGDKPNPDLPDPFDPLPICSPGMLQATNGLPSTQTPDGYPIHIDWDGILVDDPDHPNDIIRRVRDVLEVIWKDRADAIEKEACEILDLADLRDYFRKPGKGGFWEDHISRYSKSRRKAPIYWLLQSSKKNYALWLYYHRLDKDILFKALLNYVEPKIRSEESRLDELRSQKLALGPAAKGVKNLDKDIDRQEAFLSELRDFEDRLRRAANLHLDPDLNDGVVLNIAPLRELVPWREAKSYWDELIDGKYEWSSIGKQLRKKGLVS
jgi:hypothetical protein